ncbi:hypothetical protein [Nocardia sp. NPDC049149]|uniref:hypothetical protein n=1 Tax=Nocardia sp. NPDC049149 TaxID=3364315 RepID=UPI003723777B
MRTSDGKRGYSALEPSEDYPEFETKIAGHLRVAKVDANLEPSDGVSERPDEGK